MSSKATVFQQHARGIAGVRPAGEAALCRRCAEDPFVLSLVPENPSWDVPHRLLASVQFLILGGEAADYRAEPDPWSAFLDILHAHADRVVDFVHRGPIQTNEVQRCFALLPLFLTVARTTGRPLDLLELGASGGLNLFWDRYRYRYREGTWGDHDAGLALTGEEAAPVPGALLTDEIRVVRRRGIDLEPVDAATDAGFRLLASFFGADARRVDRLTRAVSAMGDERPELLRGDYLDLLPGLLADRSGASIVVLFQTISTVYTPLERRLELRAIVDAAGGEGPLAWISTPTVDEHGQRRGDYPVELAIWPPGERRIVARMNNRGDRLQWGP